MISPARFTAEAFRAEFEIDPAGGPTGNVLDMILRHVRRQGHAILTALFEGLRQDRPAVTGIPAAGDGKRTGLPGGTWGSPSLMLDVIDNAIVAGGKPVFIGLEVAQPARPLPAAVARRFLARFGAELVAAGRTFSAAEAAGALAGAFPTSPVSDRHVAAFLRDHRPPGWANGGRRREEAIPTAGELATAARAALASVGETCR